MWILNKRFAYFIRELNYLGELNITVLSLLTKYNSEQSICGSGGWHAKRAWVFPSKKQQC